MHYFASYVITTPESGSNPFGHSFVALMRWPGLGHPVEVVHTFGYYGAPSTTTDYFLKQLKRFLGLDIDLIGNYGVLKPEETRWLDQGRGLKGRNFEIEKDQFNQILKRCEDYIAAVKQVETEYKDSLTDKDAPINSKEMYHWELHQAEREKRESRLRPFDLRFDVSYWKGLQMSRSNTCKKESVGILMESGIPDFFLEDLLKRTFPRDCKIKAPFPLYSTGDLHFYPRKQSFFRKANDPSTKLYCTVPPMLWTKNKFFTLDDKVRTQALKITKKLQGLAWLLQNNNKNGQTENYIEKLFSQYKSFSIITHKDLTRPYQQLIEQSKVLLTDLYDQISSSESCFVNRSLGIKICRILNEPIPPHLQNTDQYIPEELGSSCTIS